MKASTLGSRRSHRASRRQAAQLHERMVVNLMIERWEAMLSRTGNMRSALIESAHRERPLWHNMCRLASIGLDDMAPLQSYIRKTYEADGSTRPGALLAREVDALDPEILADVGRFARQSIRDGAAHGVDRRRWVIEVPVAEDRRIALTLEQASQLGNVDGRVSTDA